MEPRRTLLGTRYWVWTEGPVPGVKEGLGLTLVREGDPVLNLGLGARLWRGRAALALAQSGVVASRPQPGRLSSRADV